VVEYGAAAGGPAHKSVALRTHPIAVYRGLERLIAADRKAAGLPRVKAHRRRPTGDDRFEQSLGQGHVGVPRLCLGEEQTPGHVAVVWEGAWSGNQRILDMV